MRWIKSSIYIAFNHIDQICSLTIKFPNGASIDHILVLSSIFTKFHPFSFPDFESGKEIQSENNEPSPRAMEVTYHWKHTPHDWLSTPSPFERASPKTWPSHAPKTW